ncbi:MAG: ribosome rescue protein RqcH [Candidatus Bathyarchaeia archaeon]
MPRESMSSFDIAVVVTELNSSAKEAFIDNIYHHEGSSLLIKLRREGSTSQLLIEAGRRIHLTWYLIQVPEKPSQFCMSLRRWLRNGRLLGVSQPGSERVVVLDVSTWAGSIRLIVELFGKGNIVLVDEHGEIRSCLYKRRMRDRSVFPGERFKMPPPSGPNLWKLTLADLGALAERRVSIIRALGSSLGVTSPYSDEALALAGIDPSAEASSLDKEQFQRLHTSLQKLIDRTTSGGYRPAVILNAEGKAQDVTPFPMSIYSSQPTRDAETFNQALDEYFAELSTTDAVKQRGRALEQQLAEQQRITEQQQARLKELEHAAEESSRLGDLIMANLPALKELQARIVSSRREGLSWEEISQRLASLESLAVQPLNVTDIDPSAHSVTVKLSGMSLTLDFLRPPQEEAEIRYARAKEARRKIQGVKTALQQAKEAVMELRNRSAEAEEETLERRREKPWYRRFRSFRSSEGFLVVAGKDAGSNEALIKRHVEPTDVIFHSEAPGAPFVVVKTEGKTPGETTLREAATFTVCHSKAWRHGFGSSSAFYVKPEQVSKRAPSGEYLTRGSFMVVGSRNYLKGVPLRYAVGVKVSDSEVEALAGPEEALKAQTDAYAVLVPGEEPAAELARELAAHFTTQLRDKGLIAPHTTIRSETLRELIPAGRGRLLRTGRL